jgi:hypothetical protein
MANRIDIVVAAQDKATEIIKSVNSQVSILAETLGLVAVAAGSLAGFAASNEFVALEKASKRLAPELRELARAMEIGTNVDEKTILGLMSKIQKKGFAVDQIDDATKAALGLSEIMGITLNEALLQVNAAAEGTFTSFEYLIPGINQLATADEKLAAVSKLASQGLKEKSDVANSAVTVFDRMNVEMGNLNATVGKILEPFRQLAFEGIAKVAELLTQALTPAIDHVEQQFTGMGDSVANVSRQIVESMVYTFTAVEVGFTNIVNMSQGWGAALLLPIEQARSGWVYAFDFMWAFVSKFADNVLVRLNDLARGFAGVTNDIILSTLDFGAASAAALTGNTERAMLHMGELSKRKFLEGFEWTDNNELFIAPPVVISEWEKTLQSMVDGMNTNIFEDFEAKFSGRMEAIKQDIEKKPIDAKVNIKTKSSDLGALSGMQSDVKMLQSTESRLLVRGATDDPLLRISQQQYQVLQDILNATLKQPQIVVQGVN